METIQEFEQNEYVPPQNPALEDDDGDDSNLFDKSKKRRIWLGIFIVLQLLMVVGVATLCLFSDSYNENFVLSIARLLGFLYVLPILYSFTIWMTCIVLNKSLPHLKPFIIIEATRLVVGFIMTLWVVFLAGFLAFWSFGEFFGGGWYRISVLELIGREICGFAGMILPPVSYALTTKYLIQNRKEDFSRTLKIGRYGRVEEQLPLVAPRQREAGEDDRDLISTNEDAPLLV